MKKKIKTILAIYVLLLMLCVNKVKAINCEELELYAGSNSRYNFKAYMKYNGIYTPYEIYQLYDNYNTSATRYSIYCRNPGVTTGGIEISGQTYYCTKTVFDSTVFDSDDTSKIYDAGIINILKNGYSDKNPDFSKKANVEAYVATNLALRVFELLSPADTNGNNIHGLYYAHRYYANKWLDDKDVSNLLKEIYGETPDKFDEIYEVSSFTDESGNVITDTVEKKAKALFVDGMNAAKYYKENGAATLKGIDNKPLKEKEVVTVDDDGNRTYKTTLTYIFEADKFKSINPYIKIKFNCKNCSKYDVEVDYELLVNGKKVEYNSNTNIVNYLDGGSGKIEFKIIFSASSNNYKCDQLNYDLELEWFDKTIDVEAYEMYSSACNTSATCQYFYMLYAKDVSTKKTIDGTIELCSLTCKDLEELCTASNNKNSDACQQFVKKYGGDCAECTTYINNATCSENDSNIDIVEGYDVDTANCGTITEDNNLNVLQCIINNEDAANNSYKATNLISNEFCSVFCKEDYHFTLPGIQNTTSGRYFSLKASIKGTKTCYTSKIDDTNKFSSQLELAKQKTITAFNEWSKYNAIVNAEFVKLGTGNKIYKKTAKYVTYDEISNVGRQNNFYETYGSNSSSNCSLENCIDITYLDEYNAKGYEEKLKSAESDLNSAINNYIGIINRYNSCSGTNTVKYDMKLNDSKTDGWKMDYNYNPTISFWYQESYMNNAITKELESVGGIDISSVTQQLCTTDTNNSYKDCSNGWQSRINKNNTTSVFTCRQTSSGYECGKYDLVISKAKYVKQEITSSSEYITPTQFYSLYPTGEILVAEPEKGNEIDNGSELTNKLPVGLGTKQGVYTYTLKVSDLGEYYNNTKLGRIWGDKNSVVVNVLEKTEEGDSCTKEGALTATNNGAYVCAYKVNCPDCPVECDESGCINKDCKKNDCNVECEKCIYTNNSTNISYKPISPGNINASDREMGINWKYDKDSIRTALELKAYVTTQEIEEKGETIYEVDYEDNTVDIDKDFAIKIKLDSKMINKIKTYNEKYKNNGGYANNTLECYDYTQDGITYENIYCYSTFIDELLYDNSTKDNIKIVGNRIIGSDATSSDTQRKSLTQTSGYWTTWAESNSNKWTITTEMGIEYYKQNYYEIGIGPSWK